MNCNLRPIIQTLVFSCSYLHRQVPGISTRDPSSERRNYSGEKRPVISTESCDFHAYAFGFFYMPQICDIGQRLYFPSEGRRAEDFFALKKPTASAGFEPANLGTKGQHATSRRQKPLCTVHTMSS